jgi:Holliday junction resolvase RusA-like endonuclease
MYGVRWSQRRVELKPAAQHWKDEAKGRMPPWKYAPDAQLRIDVVFSFPRHHGNGRYRRKDASNLLKLLIDAVAERYAFDDSLVTAGSWSSVDGPEQVQVTVTEIGGNI